MVSWSRARRMSWRSVIAGGRRRGRRFGGGLRVGRRSRFGRGRRSSLRRWLGVREPVSGSRRLSLVPEPPPYRGREPVPCDWFREPVGNQWEPVVVLVLFP